MESEDLDALTQKYFSGKATKKEAKIVREHLKCDHKEGVKTNCETGLPTKKNNYRISFAITIIALIGIFSVILLNRPEQIKKDLGTFDEPETAFKECQKALKMISEQINSNERIEPLNKHTDE